MFKMKKEIYFDIDDTLISKKIFLKLFFGEISQKTKLSVKKIDGMQKNYKSSLESSTDFRPADFLKFVSEKTGTDLAKLESIIKNKEIYQKAVFIDVIPLLNKLKTTHRLGIYSEGFTDIQLNKLTQSGIIDYFETDLMIIERRKLDQNVIKKIKKNSIIIEDKRAVVEKLKDYDEFKTVWVNRRYDEAIENVETVNNLLEIAGLLTK